MERKRGIRKMGKGREEGLERGKDGLGRWGRGGRGGKRDWRGGKGGKRANKRS